MSTLRKTGVEYGTTTGRPRRCGWFDAVIGRYANRINGVTDFVLTKLDVLTGFEKVPVCVAYEVDGVRHDEMPVTQTRLPPREAGLRAARRLVGGHLRSAVTFDDLPAAAQAYVLRVEELIGARVSAIGVGPGRHEIIQRFPLLD